ncbi:MAG: SlyX family protein [Paracoccaceae bacterium]|nr:SlyX family protein [Paracoccaceae bacterium]
MPERIEAAEEQIAHLTRAMDELSAVVAAQADEIDRLVRRVAMLAARDAGRDSGDGGVFLGDQKPPHW